MLYGDFTAGIEDDEWQVIPSDWVQAAMDRWKPEGSLSLMDAVGVDVSRGGRDESVISRRHGDWFDELICIPGVEVPDGPTLAGRIVQVRRNAAPCQVDAIGVGTSVVDWLRENSIQVAALTGSEGSNTKDRTGTFKFANKRAQWYWEMREVLDPMSGNNICLPPDNQLKADLCAPTYDLHNQNTIQVEGKKHIIKRLGRSTDRGDTVVYANIHTKKVTSIRRGTSANFKVKRRRYGQ